MIHYVPIKVKSMLHIHPHVDGGWFWSKYSAHPYLGCSYGCTYCFLRSSRYSLSKNPTNDSPVVDDPFSQVIRYKINAPDVLDQELATVPPDIITVGDYQPAEAKFGLSRRLLEVCLKHRFPVVIIVKSLLVLKDLDLLDTMSRKSGVGVVFSIASAISKGYREFFEPNASTVESRFEALKRVTEAGIYAGVSLMPVMPGVNDSMKNLSSIVEKARNAGAQFVIGGGLTLLEGQKRVFYQSLEHFDSSRITHYRKLYRRSFDPADGSWKIIGNLIKGLCLKNGLDYRMKRNISVAPLSTNKKIAEKIFLKVYEMELDGIDEPRVWQWRRAAWEIDEMKTSFFQRRSQSSKSLRYVTAEVVTVHSPDRDCIS